MKEWPVQFGTDGALLGLVTAPESAPSSEVAFIMFNAGVIPRYGPHRINVRLARMLAAEGAICMRFDLSGQGDSRGAGSDGDFRAQAVRDIRTAMDHLEVNHGIRRFALFGVCSGAVNAYWAALADARVTGLLMVDGIWYRTRWTRLVRHWKRFRSGSWPTVLAAMRRRVVRLVRRDAGPVDSRGAGLFDADEANANPPRPEFAAAMSTLVDRGVEVSLVYTGSVIDYYSYASQFQDAFRGEKFLSSVRCLYRDDIDHTFGSIDTQRRMQALVSNWAASLRGP